jgi:hypothetical protein
VQDIHATGATGLPCINTQGTQHQTCWCARVLSAAHGHFDTALIDTQEKPVSGALAKLQDSTAIQILDRIPTKPQNYDDMGKL